VIFDQFLSLQDLLELKMDDINIYIYIYIYIYYFTRFIGIENC